MDKAILACHMEGMSRFADSSLFVHSDHEEANSVIAGVSNQSQIRGAWKCNEKWQWYCCLGILMFDIRTSRRMQLLGTLGLEFLYFVVSG